MQQTEERTEFAYTNPNIFDRIFIPSQYIKGSNIETYIINFEGTVIQVIRSADKNTPIHLKINDELIETISYKERKTIKFSTPLGEHFLEIWFGTAKNFFFTNFFRKDGIALTIDNIPVQNTLADPLIIMGEGKVSLWFFFIILLLKGLLQPLILQFQEIYLISLIFYIVPSLFMLLAALTFSRSPKRAIWIGLIIGILETAEFSYSLIYLQDISYLTLFFLSFRIGCIAALIRTLKSINKLIRNVENSLKAENEIRNKTNLQSELKYDIYNHKKIKIKSDVLLGAFNKVLIIAAFATLVFFSYTYISDYINLKKLEERSNEGKKFFNEGKKLFDDEKYAEAIKLFTKSIELDSNLTDAFVHRGYCYRKLERYHSAIDDFNIALKNQIVDSILFLRGLCYSAIAFNENKEYYYDFAKDDYEKLIELNPNNSEAYYILSLVYNNIGNYKESLKNINEAIKIDSNKSEYYSRRGWTKLNLDDYYGAKADAQKSINLDSSNSEGYLLWGKIYYKKYYQREVLFEEEIEEVKKAISYLDKVTNLSKNKWELGKAYLWKGVLKFKINQDGCSDLTKAGDLGEFEAYKLLKEYCN